MVVFMKIFMKTILFISFKSFIRICCFFSDNISGLGCKRRVVFSILLGK